MTDKALDKDQIDALQEAAAHAQALLKALEAAEAKGGHDAEVREATTHLERAIIRCYMLEALPKEGR